MTNFTKHFNNRTSLSISEKRLIFLRQHKLDLSYPDDLLFCAVQYFNKGKSPYYISKEFGKTFTTVAEGIANVRRAKLILSKKIPLRNS